VRTERTVKKHQLARGLRLGPCGTQVARIPHGHTYLVPCEAVFGASDHMEEQLKSLAVILFKEAEKESAHLLKKDPEEPQHQPRPDAAEDVEMTLQGLPATLTLDLDESFLSAVHIDVQFDHDGKAYEVKLVIQRRD
jgi:hypothetical protein